MENDRFQVQPGAADEDRPFVPVPDFAVAVQEVPLKRKEVEFITGIGNVDQVKRNGFANDDLFIQILSRSQVESPV